jgi:hypothetical protein
MTVSVLDLVQLSALILGTPKNPQLRVAIAMTAAWGRTVTVAPGELDPIIGNNPALNVNPAGLRRATCLWSGLWFIGGALRMCVCVAPGRSPQRIQPVFNTRLTEESERVP